MTKRKILIVGDESLYKEIQDYLENPSIDFSTEENALHELRKEEYGIVIVKYSEGDSNALNIIEEAGKTRKNLCAFLFCDLKNKKTKEEIIKKASVLNTNAFKDTLNNNTRKRK